MSTDKNASEKQHYVFTLYISGMNPRSITAIKNLKAICDQYLPDQYKLNVIDLLLTPKKASMDQIIATPTLVKKLPLPVKTLIGDLSNTKEILIHLEIEQE